MFGYDAEERSKRHQASATISVAALVLLISLIVALTAVARTGSDIAAIASAERFGGNAIAVYSVTRNQAVAQAVTAASNAIASAPAPAPAPQQIAPGAIGSPSPPSPAPPNITSAFPPQDTATVDWRGVLQSMTATRSALAAKYPRRMKSIDPAWNQFTGSLNQTGTVSWQVADSLRNASDSFSSATRADAARQRNKLAGAVLIGAAALLGALAMLARGFSEMRNAESALQEKLRERGALLESTGEGICALDRNGDCTYVNAAAEEMLGYRADELIGKNLHSIIRHSRAEGTPMLADEDPFLQAARTGEVCRCEEDTIWRRDGSPLIVAYTCAPIKADLSVHGVVIAFADVTERKELETLRDDLNGMIVHDLRTPLTSLLTGLQTLDSAGELDATQREFLEIAIQGGETLLSMVNDLLDISKLEAGSLKLDTQEVAPAELVTSAMAQVAGLAMRNGLRVAQRISPDLPPISADCQLVRRALVNLLGNAVKFTPRGGIVTVAAFYDEAERAVVFAVGDTGEGIPAQSVRRIFEKFGQVETRKAGHKMSTGLGLTFCKLVAESHGGRIWVESKLGKGSRFLFTIPVDATGHTTPKLASSSDPAV